MCGNISPKALCDKSQVTLPVTLPSVANGLFYFRGESLKVDWTLMSMNEEEKNVCYH